VGKKRQQPEPEVIPLPFEREEIATVEGISKAIGKLKTRVELHLQRNVRERAMLDRMKVLVDMLPIMMDAINRIATERPS
jgi:DNA topoisomerase VI subunit B